MSTGFTAKAGVLPPKNWSIVGWATVAASSVIFSYLLTLLLGLVFLFLGLAFTFAVFDKPSFGSLLFTAFSFLVGGTVLWSLIPRKNEFKPNGIPIDLSREESLRREIANIARTMNEPMLTEVYLISNANAGVAQLPGGRKVLVIGLPLLQMLTVSQFRAILVHEFAHFYAGDTRLGPWVFKARDNMARVVIGLTKENVVVQVLTRFLIIRLLHFLIVGGLVLYWKLFTRLTQYISRRQEFRCDELACYVAGSENLTQGLENVERASATFAPYLNQVVMPVASRGFHPPVADGFARFVQSPAIQQQVTARLSNLLASGKTSPLDSHPPLNARLNRARILAIPANNPDDRSAITLLVDLPALELQLLKTLAPGLNTTQLKPMTWDSAGAEVYIPLWRNDTDKFRSALGACTIAQLPAVLAKLPDLASHVPDPPGMLLTREQRAARVAGIIGHILTLALVDNGWQLEFHPGHFYVQHDDTKLEPAAIMQSLTSGQTSAAAWAKFCTDRGIADLPLGTPAPLAARA